VSESFRPPRFPDDGETSPVGLKDLEEARALYAQLDPAWFDPENDPDAWLFEPEVQKLIAAVVAEEIEQWRPHLPADALVALQEELEVAALTDPVMIEYLRRMRPLPERKRSNKVKRGTFNGAEVVAFPKKKAGGAP
jgi:hypothetical protein